MQDSISCNITADTDAVANTSWSSNISLRPVAALPLGPCLAGEIDGAPELQFNASGSLASICASPCLRLINVLPGWVGLSIQNVPVLHALPANDQSCAAVRADDKFLGHACSNNLDSSTMISLLSILVAMQTGPIAMNMTAEHRSWRAGGDWVWVGGHARAELPFAVRT